MNISDKINTAMNFHNNGNITEAKKLYAEILSVDKNNMDALFLYAVIAVQEKDYNCAIEAFEHINSLNPPMDLRLKSLGFLADINACNNQYQKALEYNFEILEIAPNDIDSNIFVGEYYFNNKDFNNAIKHLSIAVKAEPNNLDLLNKLAFACYSTKDYNAALSVYTKIEQLNRNTPSLYVNIGNIYYFTDVWDKAIEAYLNSIELEPHNEAAYNNICNIYTAQGKDDEVIDICQKGLKYFPDSDKIKFNLHRAYFIKGDMDLGWEYFRLRRILNENPSLGTYLIDAKEDLKDKKILIYTDAAFGDTIQFLRYFNKLQALGAKIYYQLQDEVTELIKDSTPEAVNIKTMQSFSPSMFDYHINLTSTAYLFKNDPTIGEKYLSANPDKVKEYKEKYFNTDKLKVGLVWQASKEAQARTISDINQIMSILTIPNIQFYSLLKGEGTKQLDKLPDEIEVINLGDGFKNFSDTAAAIENLDLVVSVDTSVAHLAGGLGKEVWIMLPTVANWRWTDSGDKSFWYDNCTLFRQQNPDTWDDVIERIREKLQN